ncbi:hypothetical protein [Devosia sp.]|uniref:hypothetical protein n=1 Tax=Devosia sp. TaxID=1871048 RepID=UPI0025D2E5D3|nr:hypothetical protein [Devosia sp.]MCR6634547.1 hypothetical protein [Devosia sp.]
MTIASSRPPAVERKIPSDLIIEGLAQLSVKFNGVLVPGRQLEGVLSRYTHNVFLHVESEVFPVMLRGSGTAIRFNGRELLICTQHQLGTEERDKVSMMTEGGKYLISSGGERHYPNSTDTDAFDLVAFDFTDPVADNPELKSKFFNLPKSRPAVGEVLGVLLVGYPYSDQNYDIDEDGNRHIGVGRRLVLCKHDPKAPADIALARVVPTEPLRFDPDGMSGGTAFLLMHGADGFEAMLGGVVVRGGSEGFYVIKVGMVLDFVKSITAQWSDHAPERTSTGVS